MDFTKHSLFGEAFITFLLELGAFKLEEFPLPRYPPYHIDFGCVHSEKSLARLGQFYAERIVMKLTEGGELAFDTIVSPTHKRNSPVAKAIIKGLDNLGYTPEWVYCNHNERERIPKNILEDKHILIIDDSIAAGIMMSKTIELVRMCDGNPVWAVVGFDRMEEGDEIYRSAIDRIKDKYDISVVAVATVGNLLDKLNRSPYDEDVKMNELSEAIRRYQIHHGVPASDLPRHPPLFPDDYLSSF